MPEAVGRGSSLRLGARPLLLALVVLGWLLPSASAQALTLTVTNTDDLGNGSLRDAIDRSHNLSGPDVIEFDVTGTISLQSALPTLTQDTEIVGPGADVLTVRRAASVPPTPTPQFRVFTVAAGATSEISGMTISNGNVSSSEQGGGIRNAGNLRLWQVAVARNQTPGTGGGIFNSGTLTVEDSTIFANAAGAGGGGIASPGPLAVRNSTITRNSVLAGVGHAGGLQFGSTTTLENSTIAANSGPAAANVGAVSGTLTVASSIVSDPLDGGVNCIVLPPGGVVVSQGYNLDSANSCGFNHGRDLRNTDPLLDPLADNGGPTETMQPRAGSPIIDQGKAAAGMTTDQRGSERPVDVANFPNPPGGDGSDIGAFERRVQFVTNTNDSGPGSLRAAVESANSNPGFERILLPGAQDGQVSRIFLETELPPLIDDVSIEGPSGLPNVAVQRRTDNPAEFRIFTIAPATTVQFFGFRIVDGAAPSDSSVGGGVLNLGRLTLDKVIVGPGNEGAFGGGVANVQGELTVRDSAVVGNTGVFGAGIGNFEGTLTVRNSTVAGNLAGNPGTPNSSAGILSSGFASIDNSTIAGNQNQTAGAAANLYTAAGSSTTVVSTIVADPFGPGADPQPGVNCVAEDGAVLFGERFNLESADSCGFEDATDLTNTDPLLGTLTTELGSLVMPLPINSPAIDKGFANGLTTDQRGVPRPNDLPGFPNAAGGGGSDIGAYEKTDTQVVTNTNDAGAGSLRNAIAASNALGPQLIVFRPGLTGTINLQSALPTISGQLSLDGPGVEKMIVRRGDGAPPFPILTAGAASETVIVGLTISNGSGGEGGGISNAGDMTLGVVDVRNNTAGTTGSGGGVFNSGSLLISSSTISGNTAGSGGGVFSSGSLHLRESTVSANRASTGGGGGVSGSSAGAPLLISNSTITENSVGSIGSNRAGGVWAARGGQFVNSTIAGNANDDVGTGGAANLSPKEPAPDGQIQLTSTILADPPAGGSNCPPGASGMLSGGHNLESANTCGLTRPTDQVNTDPKLLPLADNGGPTATMAFPSDSPALDKGRNASLDRPFDQRLSPRPVDRPNVANAAGGDGSDVGAFEFIGLAVLKAGDGDGTVTSAPAGIDCGAICEADLGPGTGPLGPGTEVTLTSEPAPGSLDDVLWEGCDSVTLENECKVTMNGAKSVTATFVLALPVLTVETIGTGSGSVTSEPAGINCVVGFTCTASYEPGAEVRLTAVPGNGSQAAAWLGCDSVNGSNQCLVEMSGAKSVEARFDLATCGGITPTIVSSGTIGGTPGDDVILGSGGPDTIDAGRGNDIICAGGGPDIVSGSRGADQIDGGAGNDSLRSGEGDDEVAGGIGADGIHGRPGADTIDGGEGNDTILPGPGDDPSIAGGGGTDTVSYEDVTGGGVDVSLLAGAVTAVGGSNSGTDTLSSDIENVRGSQAADVLTALINGVANRVIGGGAADTLDTADGDDLDGLNGGAGVDSCSGDPGDGKSRCG